MSENIVHHENTPCQEKPENESPFLIRAAGAGGGARACAGTRPTAGCEYPRPVIRGSNSQSNNRGHKSGYKLAAGLDWIRGTFAAPEFKNIKDYLQDFFESGCKLERGLYSYERSIKICNGVSIHFDITEEFLNLHNGRFMVDICGKVLHGLGGHDSFLLFSGLFNMGVRFSRLDPKIDDHNRWVTPRRLYHLARRGDFAGFRSWEWREGHGSADSGSTIYFGRRGKKGSGAFIRVYDKTAESGGEVDAIRWEVEFTGDKAATVGELLGECETAEQFLAMLGSLVVGVISFIERSDKNLKRCRRYYFWQEFERAAGRLEFSIARSTSTAKKKKEWIDHVMPLSLAVVEEYIALDSGYGGFESWISFILQEGRRKLDRIKEKQPKYISKMLEDIPLPPRPAFYKTFWHLPESLLEKEKTKTA